MRRDTDGRTFKAQQRCKPQRNHVQPESLRPTARTPFDLLESSLTPETADFISKLAKALVEAMAASAWPAIRDGMVRILRKRDPQRSHDLVGRLDQSHRDLLANRTSAADLGEIWQARLTRLSSEHPAVLQDVEQLLNLHLEVHPPSAGRDITETKPHFHGWLNITRWGSVYQHNKTTVVAVAGVLALALVAVVVIAVMQIKGGKDAQPPPESVTPAVFLDVSPEAGSPGDRVEVRGRGFLAGERVQILFHVKQVARVEADADGNFNKAVTVPSGLIAIDGQSQVTAVGEQSHREQDFAFTVEGEQNPDISFPWMPPSKD